MDAVLKSLMHSAKIEAEASDANRPTREEAEAAVRTLIAWAGDDPTREGLIETPARVVKSYEELFGGYRQDPADILGRTFGEVAGYDDIVLVRDIDFNSHCEHHMVPIIGKAHVAYLPAGRVLGLSKIARVVDIFARRLQTQETMTQQITDAITDSLRPAGVAVLIDAAHQCMTTRGVHHRHVSTITTQFTGVFKTDAALRQRFLDFVNKR